MPRRPRNRHLRQTGHKPVHCFGCENRNNAEWDFLDRDQLRVLNDAKICNHYRKGRAIFHQGSPSTGMYCISSGTIALKKVDINGNEVVTRIYGEGHTLGYRAFFADSLYEATAEAVTDCAVCFIDRASVLGLLKTNPQLGLAFLRHLATDLERAEQHGMNLVTLPVRIRLAGFLLALKESFGSAEDDGSLSIDLQLSRQDIAAAIGTRPETLSRAIKQLGLDKIAIFNKNTVRIPDLDRLLDEFEGESAY